ncbi:2-oxo acid dehydrogenase subunit E2 [Gracilimonas sp.]|uniref:2-oxo acid dehydrogenase subunit E2 n=1 Tax=Gracilimonas sp. TaxID=1974203 RepID=UPI003D0B79C2
MKNAAHTTLPWPAFRDDVKDFLDLAKDRNYAYGFSEADITRIHAQLQQRKVSGEEPHSLSAYLIWCLGKAVSAHPQVQAVKHKKKLVVFEDVDVAMMIEKKLPDGKTFPFPYIFKAVQTKSFEEINTELREAKALSFESIRKRKKSVIPRFLPKFLRLFILKKLLNNPFRAKEVKGTIALTSLGNVLSKRKFWPVPTGPYPIIVATGGVYDSKGVHSPGVKKMLCFSFSLDHDILDGAPVARFGNTFIELLESASGIGEKV